MANESIKRLMNEKKVYQWQLAIALGCSENTVCRKMRIELSAEEKNKFENIIYKICEQRA